MVVFDTNFIVYLLQDDPPVLVNKETGEEVRNVKERIQHLINTLQQNQIKILIPTPVLAELFARYGGRTNDVLALLSSNRNFRFVPFDTKSAIEAGMAFNAARLAGDKLFGSLEPWQKVKFDRQIVSIAKVHGAKIVYSGDPQVRRWATELGMIGSAVWDIDLPLDTAQLDNLDENMLPTGLIVEDSTIIDEQMESEHEEEAEEDDE